MYKKFILLLLIVFSLGWLSSTVYSSYIYTSNFERYRTYNVIEVNDDEYETISENNYLKNTENNDAIEEFERIEKLFSEEVEDRNKDSPYDWIKPEQIFVYNDEVVIKIQNPEWAIYTDTKSMDPVIDSTSNSLEIIPRSEEDIHTGDIVAYKSKYKEGVVTHRVVEIGYDALGWYARLKGDNNDYIDPGKVRFEQIKRIIVAVIY